MKPTSAGFSASFALGGGTNDHTRSELCCLQVQHVQMGSSLQIQKLNTTKAAFCKTATEFLLLPCYLPRQTLIWRQVSTVSSKFQPEILELFQTIHEHRERIRFAVSSELRRSATCRCSGHVPRHFHRPLQSNQPQKASWPNHRRPARRQTPR